MKERLGNYISEYSVRNRTNENIPVCSVTNKYGFCKDFFTKEVASRDKSSYKIVPKGYFAYNPSRINVGSVDWQRLEDRVIVSPLYNVFSVSDKLRQQYLYYYLKSNIALQFIREAATGSVRDNLKLSMLYEIPIEVPEIVDQDKIIRILDTLQKIMDEHNQKLNLLSTLVKARFVEMFGEIGKDTKGWGLTKLGRVCELNPHKPKNLNDKRQYSFVAMPSVSENGDIDTTVSRSYSKVKAGFTYFEEGDVLFAKITPCMENGKGAIAHGLINGVGFGSTEFHVLRPMQGISNSCWLYQLTMQPAFRISAERMMTGSGGQRRVPLSFLAFYCILATD